MARALEFLTDLGVRMLLQGLWWLAVAMLARILFRSRGARFRYVLALSMLCAWSASPIWSALRSPELRAESSALDSSAAHQATSERSLSHDVHSAIAEDPSGNDALAPTRWIPGLVWMAGSASLALWYLLGFLVAEVRGMRRGGRACVPLWLVERTDVWARKLGIRRRVDVVVDARASTACLSGLLKPIVLLPPAWLLGLTPQQLECVLVHELVHLQRWDRWVDAFQRVIEAVLFFHPLTWYLSSWIREERELCCDDQVVRLGVARREYALTLLTAAELRSGSRQLLALPMARSQVPRRIARLLREEDCPRRPFMMLPLARSSLGSILALSLGLLLFDPSTGTRALVDDSATTTPVARTAGSAATMNARCTDCHVRQETPFVHRFDERLATPFVHDFDATSLPIHWGLQQNCSACHTGATDLLFAARGFHTEEYRTAAEQDCTACHSSESPHHFDELGDSPHSSPVRIAVGDRLVLECAAEAICGTLEVRDDGTVDAPLLGVVQVAGSTVEEAARSLASKVSEYVVGEVRVRHQPRSKVLSSTERELSLAVEECALLERLLGIQQEAIAHGVGDHAGLREVEELTAHLRELQSRGMTSLHPAVISAQDRLRRATQTLGESESAGTAAQLRAMLDAARARLDRLQRQLAPQSPGPGTVERGRAHGGSLRPR